MWIDKSIQNMTSLRYGKLESCTVRLHLSPETEPVVVRLAHECVGNLVCETSLDSTKELRNDAAIEI